MLHTEFLDFLENTFYKPSILDDKFTDLEIILRGSQKPQENYLSGRVFTQLLGMGVFAAATIFFLKEFIPCITSSSSPSTPLHQHFWNRIYHQHRLFISTTVEIIASLFFTFTLNKEYWNDPQYIQEVRKDFLQSSSSFRELFGDFEHLNKLLNYGSVTPQEMRHKLEKTLCFASHLDFVEWVLNINVEDLAAFKNQGIIDEGLFIDFSIGRSPLDFLDLISILDDSYWESFFDKLLKTNVLNLIAFQEKFEQSLQQISNYKNLIQSIPWAKLKRLLDKGLIRPEQLHPIMSKSGINDIKLLLQENELRVVLDTKVFSPKQLAEIIEKEFYQSKDLWDIIRTIPLDIILHFHISGLLKETLFHEKFLACSQLSFRQLMKFLNPEEIQTLIDAKLIRPKELKNKLTLDCQSIYSLKDLVDLYSLPTIVYFVEKDYLNYAITQHLAQGRGFSEQTLLNVLQLPEDQSIKLLIKVKKQKLIPLIQLQRQLNQLLKNFHNPQELLDHYSFSFLKLLVKEELLPLGFISKIFMKEILSEGLINFVLLRHWDIEDFKLIFQENSASVIQQSFTVSLSIYPDFFQLLEDLPWEPIKEYVKRYHLSYEGLEKLIIRSFKNTSLQNIFQKLPYFYIQEMIELGMIKAPSLQTNTQAYLNRGDFFRVFKDFTEQELFFLHKIGLFTPKLMQDLFYKSLYGKSYQSIHQHLTKNFFLMQFCLQKKSVMKSWGVEKDFEMLEKLFLSDLAIERQTALWKEWQDKSPLYQLRKGQSNG